MLAYQFNPAEATPNYGFANEQLPPAKRYKGLISLAKAEVTKTGQGGFVALTVTVIEGPLNGKSQTDRLNLHNPKPETVKMAKDQLAAYCAVVGHVGPFADFAQIANKPFLFDVDWQRGQEPTTEKPEGGYTQITAIYNLNGEKPDAIGKGPVQQQQVNIPQQQPAGGVQAQGGWPTQGGAPIDNNVAMPGQPVQQQQQPQQGFPQQPAQGFPQQPQGQPQQQGFPQPQQGSGFPQPGAAQNGGFPDPNAGQGFQQPQQGFQQPQGQPQQGFPQQPQSGQPQWPQPNQGGQPQNWSGT